MSSNYNERKRLATARGIVDYRGTASQNIQLLNTLKRESGGQSREPTREPPQEVQTPRNHPQRDKGS